MLVVFLYTWERKHVPRESQPYVSSEQKFSRKEIVGAKKYRKFTRHGFFTCASAIPLLAIRSELWNSSEKKKNFSFPLPDRGKFPKDSFGSRVRQKRKGEGEREGEKGK